jgi:hypothetical protein
VIVKVFIYFAHTVLLISYYIVVITVIMRRTFSSLDFHHEDNSTGSQGRFDTISSSTIYYYSFLPIERFADKTK